MESAIQTNYKGVIFDMDGTLTRPCLDFAAMRKELGIPKGDVIERINDMPEPARARAWAIVETHELKALDNLSLQDGALSLLGRCRDSGVKVGVITRNLMRSVDFLAGRYAIRFDAVVTREFHRVKPDPAPALHILEQWRLPEASVLMVGDYVDDITCGKTAGTGTCFFQNPGKPFFGRDADFTVSSMCELERLIFPPAADR